MAPLSSEIILSNDDLQARRSVASVRANYRHMRRIFAPDADRFGLALSAKWSERNALKEFGIERERIN